MDAAKYVSIRNEFKNRAHKIDPMEPMDGFELSMWLGCIMSNIMFDKHLLRDFMDTDFFKDALKEYVMESNADWAEDARLYMLDMEESA